MNDFVKFLGHYAGEALSIAEALNTVLGGLALSPTDQAKVQEVIDKLQAAAENIGSYKPSVIKIDKADVEAAVAAYLKKNPPKA
jgi:hypothetical protein